MFQDNYYSLRLFLSQRLKTNYLDVSAYCGAMHIVTKHGNALYLESLIRSKYSGFKIKK